MVIKICTWNGGDVDWDNEALELEGPFLDALARHCTADNGYLVLAGIAGLEHGEELALHEQQLGKLYNELFLLELTPLGMLDGFEQLQDVVQGAVDGGHDLALQAGAGAARDRRPEQVPILWTLRATAMLVWSSRTELAQALMIPVTIELALGILSLSLQLTIGSDPIEWGLLLLAQGVLGAMIGVTCLRTMLLGSGSIRNEWGLSFGKREFRYLFMSAQIALVMVAPFLVFAWAPEILRAAPGSMGLILLIALWAPLLLWITARLALVLPAAALDQPLSLLASWRQTEGHSLRLIALFFLAGIPAYLLGAVFAPLVVGKHPLFLLVVSFPAALYDAFLVSLGAVIYWVLCPRRALPPG